MRIDEELRRGLKQAGDQARFDPERWEPLLPTAGRGPGRDLPPVRRALVAAVLVAVLLAAVAVPLVLLAPLGREDDRRPGSQAATSPAPGYRTETDVDDGVSITIPDAWTFREDPSGPDEPKTVFGVGSWPFTAGGDCAPTAAHESLPADGVFLWLIEYGDSGRANDFSPRPEKFQLQEDTLAQYECSLVPSYLIRWSESDRLFQVHVAFGSEASEAREAEVLRALDSIEVGGPPAGYETHVDEGDGLAVTIPEGWRFDDDPTRPIEPENVFAFGSWPFPDGGVCAPFDALDELPADGAFAWLIEYHGTDHPEEFLPRPDRFDLADFRYPRGCDWRVPQYQFRFVDSGRMFQWQVALGPEVPDEVRREVLASLDSLRLTVPAGCPAEGPWADPDCPWSAWTRAVAAAAGHEVVGDTGSALRVMAGPVEYYLWTTETGPPPANEGYEPVLEVAGTSVDTDGVRFGWQAQGFTVWLESGTAASVPTDTVEDLVRASLAIDYDVTDIG